MGRVCTYLEIFSTGGGEGGLLMGGLMLIFGGSSMTALKSTIRSD